MIRRDEAMAMRARTSRHEMDKDYNKWIRHLNRADLFLRHCGLAEVTAKSKHLAQALCTLRADAHGGSDEDPFQLQDPWAHAADETDTASAATTSAVETDTPSAATAIEHFYIGESSQNVALQASVADACSTCALREAFFEDVDGEPNR